jgi:hypothetical protein
MSAVQTRKTAAKRKSSKPPVYLRVIKGALVPADAYAQGQLRAKGYAVGDVIAAELKKLNNPKFHRLMHRIGTLCAENIDSFAGMDAHQVLKRIQWEGNIGCEEMGVMVPGVGLAMMRFPLSLSFDSMDDGERHEVARAMCRHISEKYWPSLSPEQIEEMAECWVEEAA